MIFIIDAILPRFILAQTNRLKLVDLFLLGLHYIVKVEKTTAQFAYGLKSKSFKWLTLTANLST